MIWFCATGKTGLGHLRRCATIARAMRLLEPDQPIALATNATIAGVEDADRAAFSLIETVVERGEFAARIKACGNGPVVVDTAILPGLAALDRPLALILRETPPERVAQFRLEAGRPWDQVIIPNPRDHWLPEIDREFSRGVSPVGWIYRSTPESPRRGDGPVRVLVATGGGGTAQTATALKEEIDPVIAAARGAAKRPFVVVQAIGPRAAPEGRLDEADETFDPGGELNREFARADITISTAGYNSVLELATSGTPTLLIAIPRNIDDQAARARLWGPRLGACHKPDAPAESSAWLTRRIDAATRRAPWDLGPSGCSAAARHILDLSP
jgi:predicted glycosyltransferase